MGIPKEEQNMFSMLEKIEQGITDYTDIAGPLTEAFNILKNEANKKNYEGTDLYKLNMLNVVVALLNKINELTKIVNMMWQYNANEYKNNKQIALLGNKGIELNKNAILFAEKKNSSGNQFIPKEQWEKLPLAKRILTRFKFSDYNQLPNAKTWASFTREEKSEFLNKSIQFRINRSMELIKEYNDNQMNEDVVRTIAKINSFLYYNCKDSKGFDCIIEGEIWKDVNEIFKKNEKDYKDHEERIKLLSNILKTNSDNNRVIGIYYVKGKKIKCSGKSFEDTIIAKKNYKSGSNNNNSFKNNRNKSNNNNYRKRNYRSDNNRNNNNKSNNNKRNKRSNYYRRNNNNKDKENYKKKYDELLNKLKNQDSASILSDLEKQKKEKQEQVKPNF